MNWDKPDPLQGKLVKDSGSLPAVTDVPRPESDIYQPEQFDAPWYPVVRALGLILPSSWAWLMTCLLWGWRLVGLYASDQLASHSLMSMPLAVGLAADAVLVYAVFGFTRLVTSLASERADPQHPTSELVARIATALLFLSTLVRIVDLVHLAVEKSPPTAEFWRSALDQPGIYVAHAGTVTAVLVAAATAALARYAIGCDLEVTQSFASTLSKGRALAHLGAAAAIGSLLAVGLAWNAAGMLPSDWGRVPEVHLIVTLNAAFANPGAAIEP